MDESSKDAEIRARVSPEMLAQLTAIANGRGEKVPVILREAVTEYLARRVAGASGQYPAANTSALLNMLQEQPEVARMLVGLGRLLSSSPAPAPASPPVPPPSGEAGHYGKKPRNRGK